MLIIDLIMTPMRRVNIVVMKLLFVISEALLQKKATVLFSTVNLQFNWVVEECAIVTLL